MRTGSTEARLARQLLLLAESRGTRLGDLMQVEQRMSQSTLAGLVGVTRENVNRALRRLTEEGVLRTEDGRLVILDERRLRLLAFGR
jgi:CRP/FNR family cyclic AMP-dependent transcriptional regulator